MADVFVVEDESYDSSIFGVFSTLESARAFCRKPYPPDAPDDSLKFNITKFVLDPVLPQASDPPSREGSDQLFGEWIETRRAGTDVVTDRPASPAHG